VSAGGRGPRLVRWAQLGAGRRGQSVSAGRRGPRLVRWAQLAAGATLLVLGGCGALGNVVPYPSAKVTDIAVEGISLTALTLRFDVEVENPYTVGLPMVGLDYVLSTEGKQFLSGTLGLDQTIPAGERRVVAMPVRVPFVEVYEVASGVEAGGTVPYKADLDLKVQAPVVGTIKVPMDAEGEIKVPSVPSFLRKDGR
jgi:LEA14-like dessication related protein